MVSKAKNSSPPQDRQDREDPGGAAGGLGAAGVLPRGRGRAGVGGGPRASVKGRQHRAIALGTAPGARIHAQIEDAIAPMTAASRPALKLVETLEEAVTAARHLVPADGVVLLSPGAPSFDQFRDYAERGRAFARLGGFAVADEHIEGLGC